MDIERVGFGMRRLLVSLVAVLLALAMLPSGLSAAGGPPATFTTVNVTADGANHCKNGPPGAPTVVNCNIYDGKQYVWLNGGPDNAALAGEQRRGLNPGDLQALFGRRGRRAQELQVRRLQGPGAGSARERAGSPERHQVPRREHEWPDGSRGARARRMGDPHL